MIIIRRLITGMQMAAALAGCWSCSINDERGISDSMIRFCAGKTRSAEYDNHGTPHPCEFGVSASLGEDGPAVSDYMWNLKVSYSGGFWKSEYPIYWMSSRPIRFFATSPYIDGSTNGSLSLYGPGEAPCIVYEVPFEAAEQTDIMTATDCRSSGEVTFKFAHIMSRIEFRTGQEFEEGVSVTAIKIHDILGKATYNISTGEWMDYSTTSDFGISETGFTMKSRDNAGAVISKDCFYILPQTFPKESDATIEICLSENGIESSGIIPLAGSEWKGGLSYTYKISYSGGVFSASVLEGLHAAGRYVIDDRNEIKN